MEDIDEILGFEDVEHDFTHFKDRMLSIEMIQSHIGDDSTQLVSHQICDVLPTS